MRNNQHEVEASNQQSTTPFDLLEAIQDKNNALRAFGALLETAKLSNFDPDTFLQDSPRRRNALDLQNGLSGIINLYLADQEQALEDFSVEYGESEEYMLRYTAGLVNMAKEGAFLKNRIPQKRYLEALGRLETVIAGNGKYCDMAKALKTSLVKYAPLMEVQDVDQGGA